MDNEYLSIKDFAARAGVSHQAIYKRLSNPLDELCNWLHYVGNKKMLAVEALSLFDSNTETTADSTGCATSCATELQPVDNEIRNQYIEFLRSELEKKNEQIANLQQLLSNEQQLHMLAEQKILRLEEAKAHETEAVQPTVVDQQQEKKWWQFWK